MIGRLTEFAWVTAAAFSLLCVFVLPQLFAYWRAREKADAAETERVLDALHQDTTNDHIFDA